MKDNFISDFPIEYFEIIGLYGYKNLSMRMKGKTTIFAAENGAGKTTILNALKAVLLFDISSLNKLNFTEVKIKFKDNSDEISILKSHLNNINNDNWKDIIETDLRADDEVWDDINVDDALLAIDKFTGSYIDSDDLIMQQLYMNSSYQMPLFIEKLSILQTKIKESEDLFIDENIKESVHKIKESMANYDVVFLPTYRRVEKKLDNNKEKKYHYRIDRKQAGNKKRYHDKIYYGLSDVEDTLREITLDIERESNIGYRALSAKMLDDLINGEYDKISLLDNELPSLTNLERFLNRVRPENNAFKIGIESDLIKKLDALYSNDEIKKNNYLNYFLSKLNLVIEKTKSQESKIEEFVKICNKYLSTAGDSKMLRFDPLKLEVVVNDEYSKERISLNDLSSGEKQVISVMAILFLSNDKKNKIILIDEPELSLSLKWQRLLLPDINNGNDVSQVIAITHSPFIYDNELEKFATSIRIKKEKLERVGDDE